MHSNTRRRLVLAAALSSVSFVTACTVSPGAGVVGALGSLGLIVFAVFTTSTQTGCSDDIGGGCLEAVNLNYGNPGNSYGGCLEALNNSMDMPDMNAGMDAGTTDVGTSSDGGSDAASNPDASDAASQDGGPEMGSLRRQLLDKHRDSLPLDLTERLDRKV